MKLIEVAVELIEDIRSCLSKVAEEKTKTLSHWSDRRAYWSCRSYLSEVTVKQIEATNLISLKLHWSRVKLRGIHQKMQWIEPELQDVMDWKKTTWKREAPKQVKTQQDRANLAFLCVFALFPLYDNEQRGARWGIFNLYLSKKIISYCERWVEPRVTWWGIFKIYFSN